MSADIAEFTQAVDKAWKTFSTQEVALDPKEVVGLDERDHLQYIEQKFQQQLARARSAFLQCFRNHSVVVESEVKKIREELTVQLDAQYGEKINLLRKQMAECSALVSRHKDEIAHIKGLTTAQESYLSAIRHRWGFEKKEDLKEKIVKLKDELDESKKVAADLNHQLMCRDELVVQLRGELSMLESKLEYQANNFAEEKKEYDERIRNLRLEMKQKEDQFASHLKMYEDRFQEFKSKTTHELQIQEILNKRRSEALSSMEEERERHIKARTKPTPRIGPGGDAEDSRYQEYDLHKNTQYRVDDMGMDTSWRDYHVSDMKVPHKRHLLPKFKVERMRKAPPAGNAPVETEDLMRTPRVPSRGKGATSPRKTPENQTPAAAPQINLTRPSAHQPMPNVSVNPGDSARPRWGDQPRLVLPGAGGGAG
jgi:hypothetical protein